MRAILPVVALGLAGCAQTAASGADSSLSSALNWVALNVPFWVLFLPVVVIGLRLLTKERKLSERDRFFSHAMDMDSPENQAILRDIDNIGRTDPSFKTKEFLEWAKTNVIDMADHVRRCGFIDGQLEDTGIQALATLKDNCTDEMMQVIQSECGKDEPFSTGTFRGIWASSYGEYDSWRSEFRELLYLEGMFSELGICQAMITLGSISRVWRTFGHDHILIKVTSDFSEYPCVDG